MSLPMEALYMQLDIMRWARTEYGSDYIGALLNDPDFVRVFNRILWNSDPYAVSDEMSDLITAASVKDNVFHVAR